MEEESHHHSSSSGSLSKKKRLLKRAPEAPKRFKSAYICYVAEQLEKAKLNSTGNELKVTEAMKVLAKKWKALPDNEKEKYEHEAAIDKRRYFEELDKYSGPLQIPNKRVKKNPNAPKRAMSAFLSYSQYMRSTARQMFPELKNTELSSALAKMWREASEEEKRPHLEREQRDRSKYHKDMEAWKDLDNLNRSEGQSQSNSQSKSVQYSAYSGTSSTIKPEGRTPVSFLEVPRKVKINEEAELGNDLAGVTKDYDLGNYLDDPNNECNSLWGGTDDADLYTSDLPFDLDGWNNNGKKGSRDDLQLQESESQSDPNSESPGKTHNHNTGSTSSSSAFGSSNRSGGSEKGSGGTTSHESNSSLQGSAGYYPHMSTHSYGATSSSNGYVDGCDIPAPNQSKWNRVRDSSRPQSQAHDLSSSSPVMKLPPREPSGRSSNSGSVNAGNCTGKIASIKTTSSFSRAMASTGNMPIAGGPSLAGTTRASVQTKKTGQASYQSKPYAPGFGPFRGIAKSVHQLQQRTQENRSQQQLQQQHHHQHQQFQTLQTDLNDKYSQQSERSSGRSSSSMTNSSDLRTSTSSASGSNKQKLCQPQRQTILHSPSPSLVASTSGPFQVEPNSNDTLLYNESNKSQSSIPYQTQQDRRDGNRHFHENMMYGNRESYKPHPSASVTRSGDNVVLNSSGKSQGCGFNGTGEETRDFNETGKNKLNAVHLKQLNQWNAANHQSILNPNSFGVTSDSSVPTTNQAVAVNISSQNAITSRAQPKASAMQETRSEDSARSGPSSASDVWPFNIELDSSEKNSDKTSDKLSDSNENIDAESEYNQRVSCEQDGLDNELGHNYDSSYMQFNQPQPFGIQRDQSKFQMRCPMPIGEPSHHSTSYAAEWWNNNQMALQGQINQNNEGLHRPDQRQQDQLQLQRQRKALQEASQSVFAYPPWFNSFTPMDMPQSSNFSNDNQKSLQHPSDSILPPIYPINYMSTYFSTPYLSRDFNQTNSTEFQSFYSPSSTTEMNMELYNNQCSELISAMQNHPSYSFNKQNQTDISSSITNGQKQQQFDNFNAQTGSSSTANSMTSDVMTTSDYLANRQNRMEKHESQNSRPYLEPSSKPSHSQPESQHQLSQKSQKLQGHQENANESVIRTLMAVDEAGLFDNSDIAKMFNISQSPLQKQQGLE